MRNINLTYFTVLLSGVLLMAACKKELNVYPTTSEVDGNIIVDTKSASTVLNGVYYRLANAGVDNNSLPNILWINVQEIIPSELAGTEANIIDDGVFTHKLTPSSIAASTMWTYGYNLVNAANGFLKNLDPVTSIPAATKKQMQAEARFLRAYGNATLLLYFGEYNKESSPYGIILRKSFVTADEINLPRSPVAEVYAAILADLDDAIAALPPKNTTAYYASVSAARLLKARVLINRGLASDYQEVVNLTEEVISKGGFELEPNTKDIFLSKGFSSREVILGLQPYSGQNYKFRENQFYGQHSVSDTLVSLLKNDPRKDWVYKDDQGGTLYGGFFGNVNELTKYYSGNVVHPVQTPLTEYGYAFRLTEAYLLQSEALTMLPGADLNKAKTLLKTVMGHAGITDFSKVDQTASAAELKVLVVKEVLKNFVSENGADWLALRRLPLAEIRKIQPNITSERNFIFPVPQSEISQNKQISQIP